MIVVSCLKMNKLVDEVMKNWIEGLIYEGDEDYWIRNMFDGDKDSEWWKLDDKGKEKVIEELKKKIEEMVEKIEEVK